MAELTGILNLTEWPAGMRVIARKEHPRSADPRPGAAPPPPGSCKRSYPLRQGHRAAQPALHTWDQNRIWCAVVALAADIAAWMQLLAQSTDPAQERGIERAAVLREVARDIAEPPLVITTKRFRDIDAPLA